MKHILIGTYTSNTTSSGIYRITEQDGTWSEPIPVVVAQDPSYLLWTPTQLYWVNEALNASSGELCAAGQEKEGTYRPSASVSTFGENPCHLALSPDQSWMAVANYTSGSVAFYPMDASGTPSEPFVFSGTDHSHAHFVYFFSNERCVCCDLGADCLRQFVKTDDTWSELPALISFPKGSGPRHMEVFGKYAAFICELSSEFMLYDLTDNTSIARLPILPDDTDLSTGSGAAIRSRMELHPDNTTKRAVYLSQRGQNKISRFWVEDNGEVLWDTAWDTQGSMPRDFLLAENWMLIACQASNEVIIMKKEGFDWILAQKISIPSPVCLLEEALLFEG